jgi:hypothetical protein
MTDRPDDDRGDDVDEPDETDDGDEQPRGDDAFARGVEAIQAAATEVIAAARAMLDVADELVHDPQTAGAVIDAFASVARAATRFSPGAERAPGGAGRDDDDDGGVRRIPVS